MLTLSPKPDLLIDSPAPFDTLETWESHLRMLEALPEGTFLREELIAKARKHIKRRKVLQDSETASLSEPEKRTSPPTE